LNSDIASYTSNPTHRTPENKYYDLLTRYLPEMYKSTYAYNDRTSEILDKLNQSLNIGFRNIEDLANQIIDLLDANVLQEPLLVYLASMFNLKLRSTDPTRWRKQIKKAVPLNKSKGTLRAFKEALTDAGITLNKFSQLWQIGTDYTFTENFVYTGYDIFELEKISLNINDNYFNLEIAQANVIGNNIVLNNYQSLGLNNIIIYTNSGKSYLKYIGNQLVLGSNIKITYQIKNFNNSQQVQLHNYIVFLPLADTRDGRYVTYPKKDWNTYVIEETDPLFDLIINVKNPFYDPVIFGKIRTEFPYSEQAYNMDEYNGSLRDSYNPKDIDKNFVEPCRNTISSRFNVEVTIQNLSNIRLTEAQEVMADYMPFHAILHTLQFNGYLQDYMLPANECWEILIKYIGSEFLIAGEISNVFNRDITPYSDITSAVLRNALANSTTVDSGTANAFNQNVVLFCPNQNLENIGINLVSSNTFLQILSPHANSGDYSVEKPQGNTINVIGTFSEPLNMTEFTFILSNIMLQNPNFDIYQDNIYELTDSENDYQYYPIKTIHDVNNGFATNAWKIEIIWSGMDYEILNISNNVIILQNNGTLSDFSSTGFDYKLLDENNNVIFQSNSGNYNVVKRGKVFVDPISGVEDIANYLYFSTNNYFYFDSTQLQYYMNGFIPEENAFYIANYNDGDQADISGKILKRMLYNTGNLNYHGMMIEKPLTFPTFTSPTDPNALRNNNFQENYLIKLNSNYFYSIIEEKTIGGTDYICISGRFEDWGTITSGGTSVSYELIQYEENSVTILGNNFPFIDRSNNELITYETVNASPMAMADLANGPKSVSIQEEKIAYTIITKDNKKTEGKI
jgi:hypothetical protein